MLMARSDNSKQRFYSMSNQILAERKDYYTILEKTQKGNNDITQWLCWYLQCLESALKATDSLLERTLLKAKFWELYREISFNERQHKMLNKLLDGFDGKLTSSKWAKITKCSSDTALRDINDLMNKSILQKEPTGSRITNYELCKF